jgi:GLPGLI family protein
MKKTLFLLLCFSVLKINCQKIEGRITYIASSKKAVAFIKNKNRKTKVSDIYKNAKDIKIKLEFNENTSIYKPIGKMSTANVKSINLTQIMAGGESEYYTSNSFNGYVNKKLDCYLLGECFLIENEQPKWELKQETKKIQGFLCYKAILRNLKTNKVNLEVWYAPKIPYQYGIMHYYGLPGIILELNKNTFSITATKIELNPLKKIIIKEPFKKIKTLSSEEFKRLLRKNSPFKN